MRFKNDPPGCTDRERSSSTSEIIVIDDKSTDNTMQEAIRGACKWVFASSKRGKGTSRWKGHGWHRNDIIAFVGRDITTYPMMLSTG